MFIPYPPVAPSPSFSIGPPTQVHRQHQGGTANTGFDIQQYAAIGLIVLLIGALLIGIAMVRDNKRRRA